MAVLQDIITNLKRKNSSLDQESNPDLQLYVQVESMPVFRAGYPGSNPDPGKNFLSLN